MTRVLVCIGWIISKFRKFSNYCVMKYNTYKVFGNSGGSGHITSEVSIIGFDKISVGKNTYINGGSIVAKRGRIIIGENCLISYNVHIRTDMHNYKIRNTLIAEQGETGNDIIIGNDVWIGYGAQIMPGVSISDGCVIGAGAIVTKNTEPYSVYVGVPAVKIGERT